MRAMRHDFRDFAATVDFTTNHATRRQALLGGLIGLLVAPAAIALGYL
jgi:hypothetical protein